MLISSAPKVDWKPHARRIGDEAGRRRRWDCCANPLRACDIYHNIGCDKDAWHIVQADVFCVQLHAAELACRPLSGHVAGVLESRKLTWHPHPKSTFCERGGQPTGEAGHTPRQGQQRKQPPL